MSVDYLGVGAAGAGPYAVTTGPDGALWVTLVHAGQIARVGLDRSVRLHQLAPADCQPSQITAGPDGALWSPGSRTTGSAGSPSTETSRHSR